MVNVIFSSLKISQIIPIVVIHEVKYVATRIRTIPRKEPSVLKNLFHASIQKTTNSENTTVTYALAPDVANKIHDDRFYVAILLAHRLYELRRKDKVRQSAVETMTTPPICISNIDF